MLQQILKDMYIDPDVLNALSEDQKKTLFLKMRQEQVRRWKEREEKLEREAGSVEPLRTRANGKSVSWLLGRDGDVAVLVIGEVDEFQQTSKIICSGYAGKKVAGLLNNTCHQEAGLKSSLVNRGATEAGRTARENLPPKTQLGVHLHAKSELRSAGAAEETTAPQTSVCHRSAIRAGPGNVRPASATATSRGVRPSAQPASGESSTPNATSRGVRASAQPASGESSTPKAITKAGVHTQEAALQKPLAQEPQRGEDAHAGEAARVGPSQQSGPAGRAPACAGRGRVAQLMKNFSVESPGAPAPAPAPARSGGVSKPPLPSKPSHLRLMASSSVR